MNPLRSDVVGSLLRPEYLKAARSDFDAGRMGAADFKRIEDRAVDEAVALQEAAGLDVVTDGEMRRYAFYGHLVEALEGFDKSAGWAITFRDGAGGQAKLDWPVVVDKLRWRRQMSVEEYTYLRGRTAKPVKVTLLSAQQASAYDDPDKSRGAYPTLDAYLRPGRLHPPGDCRARAPRRENIDIDAPRYAGLLDETIREGYRQRGSDPDRTPTRASSSTTRSSRVTRTSRSGSTSAAATTRACSTRQVATTASRNRCSAAPGSTASCSSTTTSDWARSSRSVMCRTIGPWCWPVSSKVPRMESADELKTRIADAARVVPLERLALSPQCGFASTHEGNALSEAEQRQKLELVGATAREVWGRS